VKIQLSNNKELFWKINV